MLTEKDYCDYETCVALRELGFNTLVDWYFNEEKSVVSSLARYRNTYIPRISLYEAQKWLREEKNIIVDVAYGALHYNVVLNHTITGGRHIVKDKNNRIADFTEYEEALSEGVRQAVKILKEYEAIHE